MVTLKQYQGARIGVLGLGSSGLATVTALHAAGADVIGWDDSASARRAVADRGVTVIDSDQLTPVADLDKLIVSPGIPHLFPEPHPVVRAALAAGVAIDNDVGLLFETISEHHVVAVTGSNGKSTTTALIGHVLREAGRSVAVAGNIGEPVLAVDLDAVDCLVLELSSYQIELARRLAPEVAVFLNFSDDHLDRHGGRGGYLAAKVRLFEVGRPRVAVVGIDELAGAMLHNQLQRPGGPAELVAVCSNPDHVVDGLCLWADAGSVVERDQGQVCGRVTIGESDSLQGPHNVRNAAAAYGACRALGVTREQFEHALLSFRGLPHRFELLGHSAGVTFVNDSKATNPAATAEALAAVKRTRWIAGGRAKEGGLDPLTPWLDHVVKAYFIGESAADFATAFQQIPHEIAGTLEVAAEHAMAEAQAGETVLLSPACASFDQFTNFEARGDAFRELVTAHLGGC